MSKPAPLPLEWQCLEGTVIGVQRESAKTYTCSCPSCGGDVHPNGELPDRCTLWVDGHPSLHCRVCGFKAYPDQFGDTRYEPPTPAEIEARRQERIAYEVERKRSAEKALAHLRDDAVWLRYYAELEQHAEGRRYWEQRGFPPEWIAWWKFGWNPRSVWDCPTATIPIFGLGWQPLNIKHRLVGVEKGKYRYELSGQEQPLFMCNPKIPLGGHVYAVEGELKAAVVYMHQGDPNACVVGLPGKEPRTGIIEQLQAADRVTLILDPGAEQAAHDLALRIGQSKVRVLIPPMKIDDGIIACGMTSRDVRRLLAQATPV